jgi:hypothetical protein
LWLDKKIRILTTAGVAKIRKHQTFPKVYGTVTEK